MNINWSLIFSIIIGLLGIDILVLVHETGHFIMSKLCHVFVEKVQIGLGPAFYTRIGKKGTQYCLGFVPYGAFCKMDSYSLERIHPVNKIFIYLAGPFFNIVFAIVCYVLYLTMLKTNFVEALKLSTLQCLNEMKTFFIAIGDLIVGKATIKETLSGLFNASETIGSYTIAGFQSGFLTGLNTALWICASVSVSLAFANLLPIPALDGGFIFITLIELITKHKFSERFQIISQVFGLIILFVVIPVGRMFF